MNCEFIGVWNFCLSKIRLYYEKWSLCLGLAAALSTLLSSAQGVPPNYRCLAVVIALICLIMQGVINWYFALSGSQMQSLTLNNQKLTNDLNRAQESISSKNKEIVEMIYGVVSSYLANHWPLYKLSTDERISLYVLTNNQKQDYFILAGRHSSHPDNMKPNRRTFHKDQGIIGKAIVSSTDLNVMLTDDQFTADHFEKEYKIPRGQFRKLRMQSRSYYAMAIESNNARIGVILIESKKTNFNHELLVDCLRNNVATLQKFCEVSLKIHYSDGFADE